MHFLWTSGGPGCECRCAVAWLRNPCVAESVTRNVPWPTDCKKVAEPLLSAAKVKTWLAFAKRTTNVRVTARQTISVGPNLRDKASFVHVPEKVIRPVAPDGAQLGAVVIAALLVEH
jgi:hypothetical protein